jgi:hypothetical protein
MIRPAMYRYGHCRYGCDDIVASDVQPSVAGSHMPSYVVS